MTEISEKNGFPDLLKYRFDAIYVSYVILLHKLSKLRIVKLWR